MKAGGGKLRSQLKEAKNKDEGDRMRGSRVEENTAGVPIDCLETVA